MPLSLLIFPFLLVAKALLSVSYLVGEQGKIMVPFGLLISVLPLTISDSIHWLDSCSLACTTLRDALIISHPTIT